MRYLNYLKGLPFRILLLGGLYVASLFLFGILVHEVLWENEGEFDTAVFTYFSQHITTDKLTPVVKTVTFCRSSPTQIAIYLVLSLWFFWKKQRPMSLDVISIGVSGFLLKYILKDVFDRPHPTYPLVDPLRSFSFPSGHASSGIILSSSYCCELNVYSSAFLLVYRP